MEAAAEHSRSLKKHTSQVCCVIVHVSDSILHTVIDVNFLHFFISDLTAVVFLYYAGHWYAVLQSLDRRKTVRGSCSVVSEDPWQE